jgi:hypothetical protein
LNLEAVSNVAFRKLSSSDLILADEIGVLALRVAAASPISLKTSAPSQGLYDMSSKA